MAYHERILKKSCQRKKKRKNIIHGSVLIKQKVTVHYLYIYWHTFDKVYIDTIVKCVMYIVKEDHTASICKL